MVKSLAHNKGADIVVLDSLEMILQEFGAFGKEFAQATDVLYKKIQMFIIETTT